MPISQSFWSECLEESCSSISTPSEEREREREVASRPALRTIHSTASNFSHSSGMQILMGKRRPKQCANFSRADHLGRRIFEVKDRFKKWVEENEK